MSGDQVAEDLDTIQDFLDWQYAIQGGFRTLDYHKTLVQENRPMPSLYQAREAIARLRLYQVEIPSDQ